MTDHEQTAMKAAICECGALKYDHKAYFEYDGPGDKTSIAYLCPSSVYRDATPQAEPQTSASNTHCKFCATWYVLGYKDGTCPYCQPVVPEPLAQDVTAPPDATKPASEAGDQLAPTEGGHKSASHRYTPPANFGPRDE